MLEMREYNFEIKHVKGKENVVVDQPSRPVLKTQVMSSKESNPFLGLSKVEFSECQRKQRKWREVIEHLEGDQ